MKKLIIFCLCICYFSCKEQPKTNSTSKEHSATAKTTEKYIHKEAFQKLIDSANVKGAILLYDLKNDSYYSNDFDWAKKGHLPASTYKIPNSIIGLETKEVEDQHTIFKWNGEKRMFKSWEEDLTLREAFLRSCVPCYQEVARKVGVERMNAYIKKFQYGDITVNESNLDTFWLTGNAKITQFQQIDFLQRFQQETLPISKRTSAIVKEIMILKDTETFVLRGKTGWSINGDHHNGWFVGYLESGDQVIFFATNVEPTQKDFDHKAFQNNRKVITFKALESLLGIVVM